MSTTAVTVQQPVTVQAKTEIEYTPFASDDKIKLSLAVIRNYIAVPTREKDLPDDRSAMKFMMLCRSRRLNPFEGDAYLIGFRKRQGTDNQPPEVEWSLITSQSAFMKRAEVHPDFDGFESGVIVRNAEDQIVEREGDFLWNGDELLGGWCVVHFKNRKFPCRKRVQLSTYRKNFGVWVTDPAGMICKVAEVHALRDAFPTTLGGMMLREEYVDIPAEVVATREAKRPEFVQGLPAPDLKEQPGKQAGNIRKVENTTQGTGKTPQEPKQAVTTPPGQQTPQDGAAANPTGPLEPQSEGSEPTAEEIEAAANQAASTNETASAAPATPTGQTSPVSPPQVGAATPKNDPSTFKAKDGESIPLTSVRRWLHTEGKTEPELMRVLVANKAAKTGQKLAELTEAKIDNVYKARATLLTQMNQQPAT